MKWLVGRSYVTRAERTVRCLATDVPSLNGVGHPILCMDVGNGSLHHYMKDGRVLMTHETPYDILPKTRKVEGWVREHWLTHSEDGLLPVVGDARAVFVSGEVEEED